jgi:3-oxoacyl-[acyl-carrier protein] reductase
MPEVVLITGGSSDLGCALVRRLLSRQSAMLIIAHSYTGSKRIEQLQSEFGDAICPVQADLSDAIAVQRMADEISERYGAPTKIVHFPALPVLYDRLANYNPERFRKDMAIQVESAMILLQNFAPKMSKSPGARMVFVLSSVTRGVPPKYMSMYTVVKYAQMGLMRAAAAEYASTHLMINAVSPGMIETQFLDEIAETIIEMNAAANPKKRNAKPDDILGAIEFLLSADSGFIAGADIPITAGGIG